MLICSYTADGINSFIDSIGISRRGSEMFTSCSLLEKKVSEDLDKKAPRTMAVIDPIKITLTNLKCDVEINTPLFPKNVDAGSRKITLEKTIFIEKKDFREFDDPDFFGLAPGKEVGLKYCGIIKCEKVIKDEKGNITELECSYSSESKKTKGRLHWLGNREAIRAEVRMYDYLFLNEKINYDKFLEELNPNSLVIMDRALVHTSVANKNLKHLNHLQFERNGYFVVDYDTNVDGGRYVFNSTVSLN